MVFFLQILDFQIPPRKAPDDSAAKLTRLDEKYYNRVSGGDYGLQYRPPDAAADSGCLRTRLGSRAQKKLSKLCQRC